MRLKEEDARAIQEAFGGNTTVFECYGIEDLIEDAKGYASRVAFVRGLLKAEDARSDYGADIRAEGDSDYKSERAEYRSWEREIRERLKEGGFLPQAKARKAKSPFVTFSPEDLAKIFGS